MLKGVAESGFRLFLYHTEC